MNVAEIGKNIALLRKNAGLTQDEFAEKLGVTPQAISKWENGHNLPDIENLMRIAELMNLPYAALLSSKDAGRTYGIRVRLFHEDNMFTRMRTIALSESLSSTYKALQYMREYHAGQFRKKGKFATEQVQYINHPLMMACQAHAMGLRDDVLLAAILLHDVVEDTGVRVQELPFDREIREIVDLVSFSIPEGMTKAQAKAQYYERIGANAKACLVKVIDRCNNVSTMVGSFSRERLEQYILETEEYILPLLDTMKNIHPAYSDAAFLIKYHLLSVLETIKCLLMESR